MRILDVGCGNNKDAGTIGVDISLDSKADVVCDLNKGGMPFRDDSFDYIVSRQVFEHLDDVERALKELHRIARSNATIRLQVPHFSCFYAYGDPTHKRSFSVFSFDKIAPRCGLKIRMRRLTFHRAFRRYFIHKLANRFPQAYERFWAFIIPSEHLHFEFEVVK